MKTLERRYSRSERIIAKAKFSASVYAKTLIIALVLGAIIGVVWAFREQIEALIPKAEGAAPILTDDIMHWVLLGAGGVVILSFIIQAITLYAKELIVTEDKVVFRVGVLSVRNTTIPISEIVIIETKQNILQRLCNTGTVSIVSDAEQPYRIKGVKSADRLTRRIMKQVATVKRESDARRMQLQLASYVPKKR
ncbi:MAG: PH domain-containing protein [Clostridia bacterium]|nr:PH domain-containing protein [Clostridia bacterium]